MRRKLSNVRYHNLKTAVLFNPQSNKFLVCRNIIKCDVKCDAKLTVIYNDGEIKNCNRRSTCIIGLPKGF